MLYRNVIHFFIIGSFASFIACSGDDANQLAVQDEYGQGKETSIELTAGIPLPIILNFWPISGNPGTEVTLIGKFKAITSVSFGFVKAESFRVSANGLVLTATVPTNVVSRPIIVKNAAGSVESLRIFESLCDPIVKTENSLVITDLSVVEDPIRTIYQASNPDDAVWSFPFLMDQMRPLDKTIDEFLMAWLNEWKNVTAINGFSVTPRLAMDDIISKWPKHPDGTFDLEKAPFRLLAITNRMDLRSDTDAGQGRFVFGILNPDGSLLDFTVILEYKLPLINNETLADWTQRWNDLSAYTLPSAEYNRRLASLTRRFSTRNFTGIFTNGNAIGQVRTNENALGEPWEFREFKLDATSGFLRQTTTAQTPDESFDRSFTLDQFMLDNNDAILNGSYLVPSNMLSGAIHMKDATSKWKNESIIVSENVRHEFSMGTCNGCHAGETGTNFLHILPRQAGVASATSFFLFLDQDRRLAELKSLIVDNLCTGQQLKSESLKMPRYRRVH